MAVTRLLHYLSRTANNGLIYHGDELDMHAYSDSDWATCSVTRRSISGTVVFVCGAPVSWMSRRQQTVATSSMEADYNAAYYAAQDIVWFRALLSGLDLQDPNIHTTLFINNESARSLAHNPVHHARAKHIDVKFHWLREQVQAGILRVEHVNTHEQKADVLTKPKPWNSSPKCKAPKIKISSTLAAGQTRLQYPDITFPPHWPQAIPSGHRNQKISNQLESDYSLAARNIYDVLDTLDQQDEVDQERDDEDDRSTGAPSQVTHPNPAPSNPATNPTEVTKPKHG
jgi:hypothetical protein